MILRRTLLLRSCITIRESIWERRKKLHKPFKKEVFWKLLNTAVVYGFSAMWGQRLGTVCAFVAVAFNLL